VRTSGGVWHLVPWESSVSFSELSLEEPDQRRLAPMEIDPVCGMEVDPATAEWTYEHQGTTYYFCAKGCMEDFAEDPESYLG
jgi:YHS domain-containing protein